MNCCFEKRVSRSGVLCCAAVVLVVTCISIPSFGGTWRVEQNGSGEFLEIQDAVNVAAAGDTIFIGPGNYNQAREVQIGSWPAPTDVFVNLTVEGLTLIGAGADQVVIGPDEYYSTFLGPVGISEVTTTPWTVEGVTLRNMFHGVYTTSNVEVSDCRIEELEGPGLISFSSNGFMVINSDFTNCDPGISTHGLSSDIRVVNTNFINSWVSLQNAVNAEFIQCRFEEGIGGVQFDNSSGVLRSCIFVGFINVGVGGINGSNVSVDSCQIEADGAAVVLLTFSNADITTSVLKGGHSSLNIGGGSTMSVDGSHILPDGGYLVHCSNHGGPTPIHLDFTGNYWGTTDLDSIADGIWDANDTNQLSVYIDYDPIAGGPVEVEKTSLGSLKAMFR